jgi:hypothetical protein
MVARYAPLIVWLLVLLLGVSVQAGTNELTAAMAGAVALVTVLQIAGAISFFRALRFNRRPRLVAFAVAASLFLAAPLLIPAAGALRFVTACASVLLVMKLWDLHVHVSLAGVPPWDGYVAFVLNPFAIVWRRQESERRPSRRENLRDLSFGVAGTLAGALGIGALYLVRWRTVPLLVEHVVKAFVIFATMLWALRASIALVRLAGGVMRDYSDAPFLACTPADFWRRYNRVLQQYFYENVFKPVGGRRSPVMATMVIFAVSGLLHEYVFGLSIGRVQGFQMAFFLIQGAAVSATLRVRPKRRAAVALGIIATLVFNAIVSFLFFLSFHALVRLYANPLPWWAAS